jgi:hypothetical protein
MATMTKKVFIMNTALASSRPLLIYLKLDDPLFYGVHNAPICF